MREMILKGVVGSKAYGLDTPDSDIDYLGVHLAPAETLLGLHPKDRRHQTIRETNPDFTSHELTKYCLLALKANPTIMELLWLPEYETITPTGQLLVDARDKFLGAQTIRNAYTGFAVSQARTLQRTQGHGMTRSERRVAKQARHAMRVTLQGYELLTTQTLTVDATQHKDLIAEAEQTALTNVAAFVNMISEQTRRITATATTLPDIPDNETINTIVVNIRLQQLTNR